MYKLLCTGMFLCLFVSRFAYSTPQLLYPEYIRLLNEPIVSEVNLFSEPTINLERLINIIIHQSTISNKNSIDFFLKNVNSLLKRDDINEYKSIVFKSKINALLISGRFNDVIRETNALKNINDSYKYIQSIAYMELDKFTKSIEMINSLSADYFKENKSQILEIATRLVFKYQVISHDINLPESGDALLSEKLFKLYFKYELYSEAYFERDRMISRLPLESSRNKKRIELLSALKKYNFPVLEVKIMEDYLRENTSYKIQKSDLKYINKYTKLLMEYYYDKRNNDLYKKIDLNKLLGKQRLGSFKDKKTKINLLKNIVLIYDHKREKLFYNSLISLAILTNDKGLLSSAYESELTSKTKISILKAYLSIPIKNKSDYYMSKELSLSIDGCESDGYSSLVYALKAHELTVYALKGKNNSDYIKANVCFNKANLDDIPKIIAKPLLEEKFEIAYMVAKQSHDKINMLSVAKKSGDKRMQYDALNYFIKKTKLNSITLQKIQSFINISQLSRVDVSNLEIIINNSLIEHDQKNLLISQYEKDPKKYALDLIWLAIEKNDHRMALNYILYFMSMNRTTDDYSQVKIIRYLDSYYQELSSAQLFQLESLSKNNQRIKDVITLNKIENQLNKIFNYKGLSTLQSVSQGSKDYNRIQKTLNVKYTKYNDTAMLLINARLYLDFSNFLISESHSSEGTLKPMLLEKGLNLKISSRKLLVECIKLKVEGVQDIRIVQAIELKESLDESM